MITDSLNLKHQILTVVYWKPRFSWEIFVLVMTLSYDRPFSCKRGPKMWHCWTSASFWREVAWLAHCIWHCVLVKTFEDNQKTSNVFFKYVAQQGKKKKERQQKRPVWRWRVSDAQMKLFVWILVTLYAARLYWKPWPNYRTKLDSTCNIVGCKCWGSGKTLSNIARRNWFKFKLALNL